MNHRGSALLQFSLGLVTTKFIDTKSVSREPGGYKCKTAAVWDIYNLCALDVLICKKKKKRKNFRGILMGLKLRRRREKKKSLGLVVCPSTPQKTPQSKSLYTTRKMKTFWFLTNSAIEAAIMEKNKTGNFIFFYFNALLIRLARFSWAPLRGQSSGRQHCPIQSTKGRYFHWSMSFRTKQIEIDNTLQQNPTVN